ncbi:hypothetical protein PFZ49_00890 [Microbacterium lacticum]|uniref:hypothetical protein n=1 Tax=Microbacterium lacticum TaxID=33885 RepID=UPI003A8904EC
MAANTPTTTKPGSNASPEATEPEESTGFDRRELSRVFSKLRHEVGGLVDDAGRKRPFFARSKEEAIAKRDAAVKVLTEFADRIDNLKKQE